MTTEDLQGQVARSAAVERELREQIGKLREELAEARRHAREYRELYEEAEPRLRAALAEARGALREARKAIDRDRTGLAAGLNAAIDIVKGYHWLAAGEWGSYRWDEQTEKTIRAEIGNCFAAITEGAGKALRDSGTLATQAVRAIDAALARAGEQEAPECMCRRTETYIENRGNCPEHPAPSRFPDHNSAAGPIWRDKITAPAGEPASGGQEEFVGNGVSLIAAERQRQIEKEGWTPEHDDEHAGGELALAAACYANPTRGVSFPPNAWPWAPSWWKPSPTNRVRELAKAGALIAAEIDRLLRAAPEWYATAPPGEQGKGGGEGLREALETIENEARAFAAVPDPAEWTRGYVRGLENARMFLTGDHTWRAAAHPIAPAQPAEHPASGGEG